MFLVFINRKTQRVCMEEKPIIINPENKDIDVDKILNSKEVNEAINSFEESNPEDDDEFTIDPRTGSKTFKLDENGCRKGWSWSDELGRCVPSREFLKESREIANNPQGDLEEEGNKATNDIDE